MAKLLTIIIPSYNVSAYLRKGCESLNLPEYHDRLEVLIINDGSKDNTSEIGHEFENRYPGTYLVIDKSNGNYGSCVNRGLAEASGTFVKIMDGDDSFDKDGFADLIHTLEKFEDEDTGVDLILSRVDRIDASGKRWPVDIKLGDKGIIPVGKSFDLNELNSDVAISMAMMTYRRSVFSRFSYHQTEGVSYTDNEFRILPMVYVRKAYAIPAIVYLYLVGRNGQTINPDTFAANLGVIMDLTMGMVGKCAEYEENGAVIGEYVKFLIQDSVDMMYLASLCGWKNYSNKLDIAKFDLFMELHGGDFYKNARKRQIRFEHFPLSLLSFYPVRVWDRWHTVNAPRLLLHRMLKKIIRKG